MADEQERGTIRKADDAPEAPLLETTTTTVGASESATANVTSVAWSTWSPDNAVAVKVSDLHELVEYARQTGNAELAARFPMFADD